MSSGKDAAGGMLIVAEYFDREDDRFVDALREVFHAPQLAGLVVRWNRDPRPWARQQVFAYLDRPLNAPGHHVVVKRLFKQAEEGRDHEQMAAFLTAFDRLIRRERKKKVRYEWDRTTRQSLVHETEYLANPRDNILAPVPRKARDPRTGKEIEIKPGKPYFDAKRRLFTNRTRRYLQRRAWRYFRRLGFQKPKEYVAAIATALLRYADEDVRRPENLLDSWGLMHACFGKHSAIEFHARSTSVRAGQSLAALTAAPYFEPLWADAGAATVLWRLLLEARSRTVRLWARQLLERHHAASLRKTSVETLRMLLNHDDPDLQQFGATLLAVVEGVENWPVSTWLELLDLRDPTALGTICEQMLKRVSGDRLDLPQTLQLANAKATPVARIGLQFLRARKWDSADDRRRLVLLGNAKCEAVAGELATLALGIIGTGERYDREVVVALFDSLLEPMREASAAWFAGDAAAQDDPVLWSRLIETPYDDVRLQVVQLLERRAARPRIDARDLSPLWSSVLLGVTRGGRQKLAAVRQLVAAVLDKPENAPQLVAVLGTAVRSIRGPEQRAGLAGVARLIDQRPELAAVVQQALPELSFTT